MMIKAAHWTLNAILLAAGGLAVYLGFTHTTLSDGSPTGTLNQVMTVIAGVALIGIGAATSWFTWKRG